jgi:hypothetical protein
MRALERKPLATNKSRRRVRKNGPAGSQGSNDVVRAMVDALADILRDERMAR